MPPRGRAYRFVSTPTGSNSTTREFQRTVRSHAASVSHPGRSGRRQIRTRTARDHGQGVIVFDANDVGSTEELDSGVVPEVADAEEELTIASRRGRSGQNRHPLNPNTPPWGTDRLTTDYLSGDTFSPLQNLATYHKPYLPGIFNHYIRNLTIPIPELDGNSPVPLFRATWLPIVFHDPVVFQVVVLFAATHYTTYADPSQFNPAYVELLGLKQLALSALIRTVQGEQTEPPTTITSNRDSRDTLIAAAAKMASYEAIFGTSDAFHLHMSTVTRLLRLQGGLQTLGMDGFLARFLSFVDTNSSFLLGTNLYLVEFGLLSRMPHHQVFPPGRLEEGLPQATREMSNTNVVNLERFVGLMDHRNENNQDS